MATVVVLGASPKPERYSFRAVERLLAHGHRVIPVAPRAGEVAGLPLVRSLDAVSESVDTITVYVGPARQSLALVSDMIRLSPRRIIFNPGAENPPIYDRLRSAGIDIDEACTLVMLGRGQF